MGYAKIRNLYQDDTVLVLFKEVYCLEKIHGTSAHVAWRAAEKPPLRFYSGGEKHSRFVDLFCLEGLSERFTALGCAEVTVYGECYGASQQKQSHRYGVDLRFVAFEVNIDGHWLSVPNAVDVCKQLGLEFVDYVKGPATLEFVNAERDKPSVQAVRNGIKEPQTREGVVIRPLIELTKNNGDRIVAKHKTEEFMETKTPREVDPARLKVLSEANAIAEEWVTEMRLTHVLDKLGEDGKEFTIKDTGSVVKAMIQDVKAESPGEVEWSKEAQQACGRKAALLFKKRIAKIPL